MCIKRKKRKRKIENEMKLLYIVDKYDVETSSI